MGDLDDIRPAWRTLKRKWEHSFHPMCSYMGSFPASLPHYFIHKLTDEGDVVVDPFAGRGTTPLQSCVDGRVGVGNDLHPMAYVLTRAKVDPPTATAARERIEALGRRYGPPSTDHVPERVRMLYHDRTLKQLVYLKHEFGLGTNGVPDDVLDLSRTDAFVVGMLLGIMHGPSDQFLSLSMPNTFSMSAGYLRDYIDDEGLVPPNEDVFHKLVERLRLVYNDGPPSRRGHAFYGDARDLPTRLSECAETADCADLVFTSPPYLKVLKYGLYNWIRLWLLGEEPDAVDERLDAELDLDGYLSFMEDTLAVSDDVLDDETGVAAFVIGDVTQAGKTVNLAREVAEQVVEPTSAFQVGRIVEDRVPDNEKVSRIWGNSRGEATDVDRILIVHRGEIRVRDDPVGLQTRSLPGRQRTLGSFE